MQTTTAAIKMMMAMAAVKTIINDDGDGTDYGDDIND